MILEYKYGPPDGYSPLIDYVLSYLNEVIILKLQAIMYYTYFLTQMDILQGMLYIINPRRACAARVTVDVSVCLSVCLFVCRRLFSHYRLRRGL